MSYKYETHLHTTPASACGASTGAEQAKFMKEQGYTGIFVTDHFFHGNTGIDRNLPWNEWVEQYYASYENAKEMGDKIGLDVFFGIEWNFNTDEYLLYGVDKDWLLAYPEMNDWSHDELFRQINAINGLMVQAHPFRDRGYVPQIHLYPELCHAAEVYNTNNHPYNDRMAFEYARHFNLPFTSGTDIHEAEMQKRTLGGVVTEKRLESVWDYVALIKSGTGYTILTDDLSVQPLTDEDITLKPIEMVGKNGLDRTNEIVGFMGDRFPELRK